MSQLQRGWSLHQPAGGGNVEAVKRLLSQGADVEERDQDGWSPLRWAVQYGHLEVVMLLLKANAQVDARFGGKTCLHRAAYLDRPDLCEALLKAGADPNARDDEGYVPFDIVYCPKDHRDYTREVLQSYGAKKNKNLDARVNVIKSEKTVLPF